jgi:hypothetical protein
LFPIFIDLFLWLGPKLRIKELFLSLSQNFLSTWSSVLTDTTNSALTETFQQNLDIFLDSFNLFSSVNTFPVGVPTLISAGNSLVSPFGMSTILEVGTIWNFLGISIALSLSGIILGSIFFREIALITKSKDDQLSSTKPSSIPNQIINVVVFMGLLVITLGIVFTILLFFVSLIALFSPGFAQLVLLASFVAGTWFAMPLMFGAHSIFMYDQPFYKSIISGYRVMNLSFRYRVSQKEALFTLPKSVSFIFLVYILYEGLNLVWRIPDPSSFLLLIGIFGHAFIATALLISSFHYFSELKVWQDSLKTAQQQISVFNQ